MAFNHLQVFEQQQEVFPQEMEQFSQDIQAFLAGDLDPDVFRKKRLVWGVYEQLPHVGYMTRIRVPAGRLTTDQARILGDIAAKHAHSENHITTRQTFQFHWMPLEKIPQLYMDMFQFDMNTRGASMDGARNVKCDWFAGLDPEEPFDVSPYALAVNFFYLYHAYNLKLPRKYKMGFSGTAEDRGQIFIDCLGFMAAQQDGQDGFMVTAGGGLGAFPVAPAVVMPFIPADEVLYAADASIRIFHDHGNRKDRKHARLKMIKRRLGEEAFAELFQQYFEESKANYGDELRQETAAFVADFAEPKPALGPEATDGDAQSGFGEWKKHNVFLQKQSGYAAVTVKLVLGDANSPQLHKMAELADKYGNGTMRLTGTQKIVIPFLPIGVLPAIHRELAEWGLGESGVGLISDVVSCPGLDYCSLAVSKSRGVGAKIRENLNGGSVAEEALGQFSIKISGCPNACGHHHIADIGLTGMTLVDASGKDSPHWGILLGGKVGLDGQIGKRVRRKIPELLAPLVVARIANDYLDHRDDAEEPFWAYADRKGREHFEAITDTVIA